MGNKNIKIQEFFDLGLQNFKKNNLKDAESFFKEVLNIEPNHLESIFLLGILCAKNNNIKEAKKLFERVVQIDSNNIEAHYNLALSYYKLGEFNNSINCYEKVIQIDSKHIDAYHNLGALLSELGDFKKAKACYEKLIKIDSNQADVHYNLGNVFKELEEIKKAKSCYEKAIQINPKHELAHNNLGIIFYKLKELQKAIICHEKAITIKPNYADGHHNLGIVLSELGYFIKAKNYYEKAIQINPKHIQANYSLGLLLLENGYYEKGFEKYEWRKKFPFKSYDTKNLTSLEWQGEDLNNKTILILSEQGWGDIIQFSRYLYILEKEYSVNIIFRTKKKIMHFFNNDNFKVISEEEPIPKHEFYKHLMSLPKIFYKKTKTFPNQINYIPENKKIFSKWKNQLQKIKGLKVGIYWQGRKTYSKDHLRSISLNQFEQLFNIKGVNFISLQKGFGSEQINNFKYKHKLNNFSYDVDNGLNIFEDTIGILKNIDLVISIDSSMAHLSATLGIKTWVLLNFCHDWRWNLINKEFSWYENLKIYRQDKDNKWDSIFNLLKKDLVASLTDSKHNII